MRSVFDVLKSNPFHPQIIKERCSSSGWTRTIIKILTGSRPTFDRPSYDFFVMVYTNMKLCNSILSIWWTKQYSTKFIQLFITNKTFWFYHLSFFIWCPRTILNRRHEVLQTPALPLSYAGVNFKCGIRELNSVPLVGSEKCCL